MLSKIREWPTGVPLPPFWSSALLSEVDRLTVEVERLRVLLAIAQEAAEVERKCRRILE